MAVPSTNVTFASIQTEFGGSNPIALSEYYSGGSNVPATSPAPNGPIPSSGQISVGQFRAAVKQVSVSADYLIISGGAGGSAPNGGGGGAGGTGALAESAVDASDSSEPFTDANAALA